MQDFIADLFVRPENDARALEPFYIAIRAPVLVKDEPDGWVSAECRFFCSAMAQPGWVDGATPELARQNAVRLIVRMLTKKGLVPVNADGEPVDLFEKAAV
jgi:hypothetical protein